MNEQKRAFLQNDFLPLVAALSEKTLPIWGKMTAQHMLEHVAGFFEVSTNKRHYDLVTPLEHLPQYRDFLWSEKAFRENTKAVMLPDEPMPLTYATYAESLQYLKDETGAFFDYFSTTPEATTQHPIFGDLDFNDWVQLHHKHVVHHLKQFGVPL